MGADIHIFGEYYSDNRWLPSFCQPVRECLFIGRNYNVFCAMAPMGRRDPEIIKPIAPCRGIPEDASHWAKQLLIDDPNIHHRSWLTFEEVYSSTQWSDIIQPSHLGRWFKFMEMNYIDLNAQRVLFGFDN